MSLPQGNLPLVVGAAVEEVVAVEVEEVVEVALPLQYPRRLLQKLAAVAHEEAEQRTSRIRVSKLLTSVNGISKPITRLLLTRSSRLCKSLPNAPLMMPSRTQTSINMLKNSYLSCKNSKATSMPK
jgi:hypothetical protein